MTTQPNDQAPDLDAAIVKTAIRDAFAPLAAGLREAWDTMRPVLQAAARDAETLTAAHYALAACFEEDAAAADTQLNGLDAEQLRDIIGAANLLAEKADARHAALTTIPEETDPR